MMDPYKLLQLCPIVQCQSPQNTWNELANTEAKKAHTNSTPVSIPFSQPGTNALVCRLLHEITTAYWASSCCQHQPSWTRPKSGNTDTNHHGQMQCNFAAQAASWCGICQALSSPFDSDDHWKHFVEVNLWEESVGTFARYSRTAWRLWTNFCMRADWTNLEPHKCFNHQPPKLCHHFLSTPTCPNAE